MFGEPVVDRGRLVGRQVVADQVHVQLGGYGLVDRDQEFLELDRPMSGVELRDHGAVGDVECREQVDHAVTGVVVVYLFSGMPGIIGSTGWERSNAWTWLFSSTHSTTAFSGGLW